MRRLIALCHALDRSGQRVTLIFHGLTEQEKKQFLRFRTAGAPALVRAHFRSFQAPINRNIRIAALSNDEPKCAPRQDFIVSSAWKSAEWADSLFVDRGVKLHLCGLEPETILDDMRARAALRVPAIKIALTPFWSDRVRAAGEFVHPLHGPWLDEDWDAAAADLAGLMRALHGEDNRHFLFRRKCAAAPGTEPASEAPPRINATLITAEANACSQIRIISPNAELNRNSVSVRCHFVERGAMIPQELVDRAHILVFQRVRDTRYRNLMRRAKAAGKKILFEIDDNLFELPEEHMFHKPGRNNERMQAFIKETHGVIVTNENLKSYILETGLSQTVSVFPNYIDTELFEPREPAAGTGGPVTIGYAGTETHDYEFRAAAAALQSLAREYGDRIRLVFVGYMPRELRDTPGAHFIPGAASYHVYARLLCGAGFDIVLAPLKDNLFNSCKSNIKFLEYSAAGAAGVYSAVAPYRSCVEHGRTGLLAHTEDPEEWRAAVKSLIDDPDLRARIARNAREFVMNNYSLKENAHRLLHIYEQTLASD